MFLCYVGMWWYEISQPNSRFSMSNPPINLADIKLDDVLFFISWKPEFTSFLLLSYCKQDFGKNTWFAGERQNNKISLGKLIGLNQYITHKRVERNSGSTLSLTRYSQSVLNCIIKRFLFRARVRYHNRCQWSRFYEIRKNNLRFYFWNKEVS